MTKRLRGLVAFWLPVAVLASLVGYATNALISVVLMTMNNMAELPGWLVMNGGLATWALAMAASFIWLARTPTAILRYRRGLRLAGWIFLLVIPCFLTLVTLEGTANKPGMEGAAGAAVFMTIFVILWYGFTGGGLLLASHIISRAKPDFLARADPR